MVAGSRIDGGTQILSARVRKTIQSIKEIVGNHSDAEIYVALKETNMDPNETAQKLLNQDPFHEVRRKRDKKKEYTGYKGLTESRKSSERAGQGIKSNPPDRGVPRGGYSCNDVARGSREFRVVRDNRINQNVNREVKPPFPQCSTSTSELGSLQVSENGSTGVNQKSSGANYSPRQASAVQTVSHTVVTQVQGSKPNDSKLLSSMLVSNHSVVGVYSSSSDPVHVPSPVSKSAANVGTIKREFGAVGVRRQPLEKSPPPSSVQSNSISSSHLRKDGIPSKEGLRRQLLEKSPLPSSAQSNSLSSSHLGKDGIPSKESFRSFTIISTSDQPCQATGSESVLPSVSAGRSFSSNQYNSRSHQQVVGHQRASQPVREWKPKPSLKSSINGPRVIGSLVKPVSHPADSPQDLEIDATHMRDKLSRLNIYENQNVFIAEHIRVSESDRCRLTFGSFGTECDSSRPTESESRVVGGGEHSHTGLSRSLSASALDSPTDGTSDSKHVDLFDEVRNSGSNTPASGALSEQQLSDRKDNSSPQNLDNYADIGLVHDNSPSFTHTESQQQQQDPPELASFSVYDPQTGYDIPYFRPTMDETVSGQGLPSPQEALGSHMSNNVPMSTIPMVQQQQQQPPMPQMYQQLHVSPFANLMPYRQFLSPVYVPPLPMPGYSGNPTYPHPSNGNSFLLMPGGSSHLSANNLKYGIQQFKHVPTGSPTGFGNFASPTGYAINTPGVVGGAAGLEESSRLKYKDGNLYVPNPQAETSEMWIQNPRDLPGLQSASYYNMAGQTPHGAYLPPHSGHTSFNAGVAQSSHMQFPGLYHPPPQPAAMANPHHLGPAMGSGSVGVGMAAAAASGAQVGAYQQQAQMGHLNWTTNF